MQSQIFKDNYFYQNTIKNVGIFKWHEKVIKLPWQFIWNLLFADLLTLLKPLGLWYEQKHFSRQTLKPFLQTDGLLTSLLLHTDKIFNSFVAWGACLAHIRPVQMSIICTGYYCAAAAQRQMGWKSTNWTNHKKRNKQAALFSFQLCYWSPLQEKIPSKLCSFSGIYCMEFGNLVTMYFILLSPWLLKYRTFHPEYYKEI